MRATSRNTRPPTFTAELSRVEPFEYNRSTEWPVAYCIFQGAYGVFGLEIVSSRINIAEMNTSKPAES